MDESVHVNHIWHDSLAMLETKDVLQRDRTREYFLLVATDCASFCTNVDVDVEATIFRFTVQKLHFLLSTTQLILHETQSVETEYCT